MADPLRLLLKARARDRWAWTLANLVLLVGVPTCAIVFPWGTVVWILSLLPLFLTAVVAGAAWRKHVDG